MKHNESENQKTSKAGIKEKRILLHAREGTNENVVRPIFVD